MTVQDGVTSWRDLRLSFGMGDGLGRASKIMKNRGRLKTMLLGGPQRGSLGSYEKARLARRLIKES